MHNLIPAYSDPLFSIILVVFLALIIAALSYWWGSYTHHKNEQSLQHFFENFHSQECQLDTQALPFDTKLIKPLTLLSLAHSQAGEYQKSITLYLYLLRHLPQGQQSKELMGRLADTYLKAGFIERAKGLYLRLLEFNPRNHEALYKLGYIYEKSHNISKAIETLEPLEMLEHSTQKLKHYFSFLQLSQDNSNEEELIALFAKAPFLHRLIVAKLIQMRSSRVWEIIDPERADEIIDLLWHHDEPNYAIINSSELLQLLYYAKGELPKPSRLDLSPAMALLGIANESNERGFGLSFTYMCHSCKFEAPLFFRRCPHCMEIATCKPKENLKEAIYEKTDNSLL